MSGGSRTIELGECDATTLHPDLTWLRDRFRVHGQGSSPAGSAERVSSPFHAVVNDGWNAVELKRAACPNRPPCTCTMPTFTPSYLQNPKMVIITNPCNPTGALMSEGEVRSSAGQFIAART